jgi:hypothetical protein
LAFATNVDWSSVGTVWFPNFFKLPTSARGGSTSIVDERGRALAAADRSPFPGRHGPVRAARCAARRPHLMSQRALMRAGAAAALVLGFVVATAGPASAHGVGGLQPSNYTTSVKGIVPPVPGLHARAVDLGTSIELRNDTADDVIVLGYQNEPYLRIGPDGTWRNARSPAVFLNRTAIPTTSAPRGRYDAKAPPRWEKISAEPVTVWHDHRTHWMGGVDPPIVTRDPSRSHVVIRDWKVPLRDDGRKLVVTGNATWVPGPSPWPWIIGAVALAAAVVALARTKRWVVAVQAALALLIVSETIHVIGAWQATTASVGSRAVSSIYSIGGILVCIFALIWMRRRDPWAATPAVLIAGLFVLIAGGLADVTALTRSQIPTTLPDAVARLTVTIALGVGTGLVIAAGARLRAPPAPRRARPTEPVPTPVL